MKTKLLITIMLAISTFAVAGVTPEQIQVPEQIMEEICQRAADRWPEEPSMQEYEIKLQIGAYKHLYAWKQKHQGDATLQAIFKKAQKDWPGDYSMQWYQVEREVEALS